jgi:hypothetical protein
MKTDKEMNPVEVFAGTVLQAAMVKSLLENADIEAFLKDEFMGTLNPWYAAPGGAGAVKVLVAAMHCKRAEKVVEEYENNLKNEK